MHSIKGLSVDGLYQDDRGDNAQGTYVRRWCQRLGYTCTGELVRVSIPLGVVTVARLPTLIEACIQATQATGKRFNGIHSFIPLSHEHSRDVVVYTVDPTIGEGF